MKNLIQRKISKFNNEKNFILNKKFLYIVSWVIAFFKIFQINVKSKNFSLNKNTTNKKLQFK